MCGLHVLSTVGNRDILFFKSRKCSYGRRVVQSTVLPDVHSQAGELSSIAYLPDGDFCGFQAVWLSLAICHSQNIAQLIDEFVQTRTQFFSFSVLMCFGNSHFKDWIFGSYADSIEKSQKRWRDGVEAGDTYSFRSDLHAHCGDGMGKRKLQGFPSNLHANGNSWEEYLDTRDAGIFLTPYGHFELYTTWSFNKII